MSQIDKYKKLVDEINEYEFGFEKSKMAMLSLIAENTAIIADSMSREDGEQNE